MALKQGFGNLSGIIPVDIRNNFSAINKQLGTTNNEVLWVFAENYVNQHRDILNKVDTPIATGKDSAEIDSAAGNVTFDYGNDKLLGYVYFSPATQQPQQQ